MTRSYREKQDANAVAMNFLAQAIERDPDFASAYGMAALCYSQRLRGGYMSDRLRERAEARRLAWRAAELGKDDAVALSAAGGVLALVVHEVERGVALIDRATNLNPNLGYAWGASAWGRVWLGEPELAITCLARHPTEPARPSSSYDENGDGLRPFHRRPLRRCCFLGGKLLCDMPHYQGTLRVLGGKTDITQTSRNRRN